MIEEVFIVCAFGPQGTQKWARQANIAAATFVQLA